MILEINQIKATKPLIFEEEVVFDNEDYKCVLPLISIKRCLAKVEASKYDDFIEVRIDVSALTVLQSSYTLKPFEYNIHSFENYHFSAYEEEEEDLIVYKGNRISLDEYIFNLISASVPLNPKAKGEEMPKSGEGYRVLTEEEFEKEKKEKTDSRFSKLDELDFD